MVFSHMIADLNRIGSDIRVNAYDVSRTLTLMVPLSLRRIGLR